MAYDAPDRSGTRDFRPWAAVIALRTLDGVVTADDRCAADLYWIPLGAGSPIVQAGGRVFEALSAARRHRPRRDLYHAALQIGTPVGRYCIEQAPVPDDHGDERGVVAVGPVGVRAAGRYRIFRYEVRCWLGGTIPDLGFAVESPVRLTADPLLAQRIVDELPGVPTPVWGRDEFGTGEMWNSNSVIAWVLTRSGLDLDPLRPPMNGRAPGWNVGRLVADADTANRTTVDGRSSTRPSVS